MRRLRDGSTPAGKTVGEHYGPSGQRSQDSESCKAGGRKRVGRITQ